MTSVLLMAAGTLTIQALPAPVAQPGPVWTRREVLAMGTRLRGRVLSPSRTEGLAILEEVREAVQEVEELLSTWTTGSELAELNRGPVGEPVSVSPELFSLLREARTWTRATGGAFDPATGALVDAWALRDQGRLPSTEELERARAASGLGALALDPTTRTVTRLREAAWVDAGAFGKGVALRRAARLLRSRGVSDGLLDFGGQILALGRGEAPPGWALSVAHPGRRHEEAALLRISDRSVATSGGSERFIRLRKDTLSHILDPRTGTPVPPWGSVTVVAEDPVAADVLSTALFVLGPEEALRWARGRTRYGVLVLEKEPPGLKARWNEAMEPYLIRTLEGTQDPKERRAIDKKENHGG